MYITKRTKTCKNRYSPDLRSIFPKTKYVGKITLLSFVRKLAGISPF